MSDEVQDNLISEFMAVTGADHGMALSMLEATDWILDEAVNLYFSAGGDEMAGPQIASASAPVNRATAPSLPALSPDVYERVDDFVRAPLPSKVERLVDGIDGRDHLYQSLSSQFGPSQQHISIEAFRNFRAESEAAEGGSASGSLGLGTLFKTPKEMMFQGTLEAAKSEGVRSNKWLLINIQRQTEFASHQLNRDTWSVPTIQDVIKGYFIFKQVSDTSPEGSMLTTSHKLYDLPAILIVDPLTGSLAMNLHGFIGPEQLMEQLLPFMDSGPRDAGAASLATSAFKRKLSAPTAPALPATEDDELELALALSMAEQGGDDDVMMEERAGVPRPRTQEPEVRVGSSSAPAAPPPRSPKEVQDSARARLPAEPADGAVGSCRVGLRLPDGSRVMRRFLTTDTVGALMDLVTVSVGEAEAIRPFSLSAPGIAAGQLSDPSHSLADAGVTGALVNVTWT